MNLIKETLKNTYEDHTGENAVASLFKYVRSRKETLKNTRRRKELDTTKETLKNVYANNKQEAAGEIVEFSIKFIDEKVDN